MDNILELAHTLSPYTICGEGNVSGRDGDDSFWIKASGTSLDTLKKEDLVACHLNAVPYNVKDKPSM